MNTNNTNNNYRPQFKLYHANARGNGSAISFVLNPASGSSDGCYYVTIAKQKTVGNARGAEPTFSTFDWDGAITLKFSFNDITQMLQVFRGEKESINDDHGLLHNGVDYSTIIKFRHQLEPFAGYILEVFRSYRGKPELDTDAQFFFNSAEALGVSVAIENMLGVLCFGIPKVIENA